MFTTELREIAVRNPIARRFYDQGFQLARPVLSLEVEIHIQSQNQDLMLNLETGDIRVNSGF